MVNNRNRTSISKHVDIIFFFVTEKIREGVVSLVHVASKDNCADIFTKPLPTQTFGSLWTMVTGGDSRPR